MPTGTIYDTVHHEFERLPNFPSTCRYCEQSFTNTIHRQVIGERWISLEESRGEQSEPQLEIEGPGQGLESHGPFVVHKLTLDGYRIPRLTGQVINGRWYFTLDERFGVDVPERDGAGVAMMIANAMAIGAGFSCFGENSQPSNEFKTRMYCITGAVSDIDALQPESQQAQ